MEWLFLAAGFLAIGAAFVTRRAASGRSTDEGALRATQLHEYEAAYLASGAEGAVGAAIGSLVYRGLLTASPSDRTITAASAVPGMAPVLERAIHAAATPAPVRVGDVARAVSLQTSMLKTSLVDRGLLRPLADRLEIGAFAAMAFAITFTAGTALATLVTGRPVGNALVFFAVGVAAAFVATGPPRTAAGNQLIKMLKHDSEPLKTALAHSGAGIAAGDVALAIGLYGGSVLESTPLGYLVDLIRPRRDNSCGACGGCGGCGCGGCA